MTEYEAQILAQQKFPDEKPKDWEDKFWISHKREREKYVKKLLKK